MIHKNVNIGGTVIDTIIDFKSDIVVGQIKADNGLIGLAFTDQQVKDGDDTSTAPPKLIFFFRDVPNIETVLKQLAHIKTQLK